MRNHFLVFACLVLLSACGGGKASVDKTNSLEKFRLNEYDMILDAKRKYKGIQFKMPSCFLDYYGHSTIKSDGFERHTSTFNAYFSVERFSESDQYLNFVDGEVMTSDMLNLFHDAYVKARISTMNSGISSLKKKLPKKVKFPGVIQVVRDMNPSYGEAAYYVVATLNVNRDYYIFQWETNKEMMGYTYDDFEDILASVRKKK